MTDDPPTGDRPLRWVIAVAGVIGAAGIAMAAAAAHAAEARMLGTASAICLANAPALLVLGLAGRRLRLSVLSAGLLTLGRCCSLETSGFVSSRASGSFPWPRRSAARP